MRAAIQWRPGEWGSPPPKHPAVHDWHLLLEHPPPPPPTHRLSLPYTLVQTAKRNVVVSHLEESVARITRLLDAFSAISQ